MKNHLAKITLFTIVAAALVALPASGRAEDKPKTTAPEQTAPKKSGRQSFHGNVTAVDSAAMTLTVGPLTLNVTSETRITKAGKPATLADIAVGDLVGGTATKDDAGKLNAATIRAGEKSPKKEKKLKPEPAAVK